MVQILLTASLLLSRKNLFFFFIKFSVSFTASQQFDLTCHRCKSWCQSIPGQAFTASWEQAMPCRDSQTSDWSRIQQLSKHQAATCHSASMLPSLSYYCCSNKYQHFAASWIILFIFYIFFSILNLFLNQSSCLIYTQICWIYPFHSAECSKWQENWNRFELQRSLILFFIIWSSQQWSCFSKASLIKFLQFTVWSTSCTCHVNHRHKLIATNMHLHLIQCRCHIHEYKAVV